MPSLTNATTPGPGSVVDLTLPKSQLRLVTSVTGAAVGVTVTLEGSIDNSAWFTLLTSNSITGETLLSDTREARFVRANLITLTPALGASPAVTASVSSSGPY